MPENLTGYSGLKTTPRQFGPWGTCNFVTFSPGKPDVCDRFFGLLELGRGAQAADEANYGARSGLYMVSKRGAKWQDTALLRDLRFHGSLVAAGGLSDAQLVNLASLI